MSKNTVLKEEPNKIDFEDFKKEVIADYELACISREASLLGRREVLTGKAKFGIFGDGKEVAQIALAKQFKDGDFRSGYYRDQTIMMAIDQLNVQQYFAALYAETDVNLEPASAGRQMGGHYSTRNIDENGEWKNLMEQKNSSADISPTAGQMSRLLGLAQASKVYRNHDELKNIEKFKSFSNGGNEVAFGTIGDASTSEGQFWEAMNAAGVLQVPMVMSVWDDGYGISVSKKFQTIKENISEALSGFKRTEEKPGFEIFNTKGWDYPHLCATYEKAVRLAREEHIPVLVHVEEVNQPQGHSTSGSHERYKSDERLKWEKEFDALAKFKEFIVNFKGENGETIANEEELDTIQKAAKKSVMAQKKAAWADFRNGVGADFNTAIQLMKNVASESANGTFINKEIESLEKEYEPIRRDVFNTVNKVLRLVRGEKGDARAQLINWYKGKLKENKERYGSHLHSSSKYAVTNIEGVAPTYGDDEKVDDGRIILRDNFMKLFEKHPEIITFGEDTGKIGGVNQSMEGMQEKFGELRVSDTGIRENTILGQGIGMAMRGLRPIAEIQYLDYLLYAIQVISDDLATLQYRTKGGQKAPVIIRTRGHRLEGIWHSGSPMGMIINAARGVNVCVPRNMTQAAGMYNTLIEADEPALVIEPLNGYRVKEPVPTNLGEFKVELGKVDVVKEGTDLTLVSYGSTFNIAEGAVKELEKSGISVELIDVQTLLPFDLDHTISKSLEKTSRLMIVDEDVSSGASAYILDQILVKQKAYYLLDSEPVTVSANDHRPAYGTDGDYFSKPNIDDIYAAAYKLMNEADPKEFPSFLD
ncbi:alpha-ketoacid dehydrogenase subunit alpha/beta [Brumimicrobium aurantiacum]|uniref:3-methyl-2-oxobutanoate dehydrogenase (2-methylpropanoyl-transferring) n=1 Tax=Brumimicrobium aurantiacum TaxID=1737063 RepID=A0A3E1F093_9FLAO|nr:alpha-ketoacid dehydrogenase subunit alpha/beta [Brumimicrobium aurantiacum]RFC55218.1 transketolase [Brumimicrobium aurantiacum]